MQCLFYLVTLAEGAAGEGRVLCHCTDVQWRGTGFVEPNVGREIEILAPLGANCTNRVEMRNLRAACRVLIPKQIIKPNRIHFF